MKILHVTNAIGWSGGLEQMVLLISELQKKGHQNILVCPPQSEAIPRLLAPSPHTASFTHPVLHTPPPSEIPLIEGNKVNGQGIIVESLSMFQEYDLFAAWKLNRIIKKYQPELVHAHHPLAHSLALLALLALSPSLVVSRRVSFPPKKNPFSRWKYRSKKISSFVTVSKGVKEILACSGVESSRIQVIYSAVHLEKFFPRSPNHELKKTLQIPDGFSVIGKIANASRWKGQHIFLEAAKNCIKKNAKLCFLLAGRDTEKLTGEVEKLGLAKHVRLLGMRTDVPEILSILDLSVNSAISGEGLSGALRESLAMGIPVIASDVAGNAELVRDGVTGFLVPANLPELLSEKILYALENYPLAKELAKKGKEWVEENCAVSVMVNKHLELYKSIS